LHSDEACCEELDNETRKERLKDFDKVPGKTWSGVMEGDRRAWQLKWPGVDGVSFLHDWLSCKLWRDELDECNLPLEGTGYTPKKTSTK
jgi:hypothetical protein